MIRILSKKNRSLLSELVRTDFKLRYQNSVLGYSWSLLRPLLLFVILYVVFVNVLKFDEVEHYPVYLLLGIVLWNFFAEMTSQSLSSIVGRGDLIRKIRIPRWIIIVSSSISALINLCLTMSVVAVFLVLNHVDIHRTILWLPLILIQIYVLALGLSLILSALFVKYRDMSYIWEVTLQGFFYLTPIIYPLQKITHLSYQKFIMLNPMAEAIQDARYAVVTHQTITVDTVYAQWWVRFIPYIITVAILVFGVLFFKHESEYFAENI